MLKFIYFYVRVTGDIYNAKYMQLFSSLKYDNLDIIWTFDAKNMEIHCSCFFRTKSESSYSAFSAFDSDEFDRSK